MGQIIRMRLSKVKIHSWTVDKSDFREIFIMLLLSVVTFRLFFWAKKYIRMSNRLWRHSTVKVRYAFLMSLKIGFNFFLTTVWTKFESINELTHAHNVELCQFYSDLVQTFQILVKNHDSPKFYGVYHPERIESIILNAKQDLLIFYKLRFTLFHETTWPYHVLEVSSQCQFCYHDM